MKNKHPELVEIAKTLDIPQKDISISTKPSVEYEKTGEFITIIRIKGFLEEDPRVLKIIKKYHPKWFYDGYGTDFKRADYFYYHKQPEYIDFKNWIGHTNDIYHWTVHRML